MKLNIISSIIAIALCALAVFGIYIWGQAEDARLLLTIGSAISMFLTLMFTFGFSFERTRMSVNIKVTSGVFVVLFLVLNIIFCCLSSFSKPLYIILNGCLLLIWLLIIYGILKASKKM